MGRRSRDGKTFSREPPASALSSFSDASQKRGGRHASAKRR
jgi:hypothetical protein